MESVPDAISRASRLAQGGSGDAVRFRPNAQLQQDLDLIDVAPFD
jgi:hypothetical protein